MKDNIIILNAKLNIKKEYYKNVRVPKKLLLEDKILAFYNIDRQLRHCLGVVKTISIDTRGLVIVTVQLTTWSHLTEFTQNELDKCFTFLVSFNDDRTPENPKDFRYIRSVTLINNTETVAKPLPVR